MQFFIKIWMLVLPFLLILENAFAQEPEFIFKNQRDGYNMFRIPALLRTKSGKILAFCEGRKSLMDNGDIDLVMRVSSDEGKTWGPIQVIWNDAKNTCGNPAPVLEEQSGDVIVVATLNNDKVFVLRSKDEGQHWEAAQDITEQVKAKDWEWYASGPGHAIQLQTKDYKHRIVVACNHTIKGSGKHIAHCIFSDDKGLHWQCSAAVPQPDTDECTVAELNDGRLLLNMRNKDRSLPNRKISFSNDAGKTWSEATFDSTLVEPICQGTTLRYQPDKDKAAYLLFVNPAHPKQRKKLTLYLSKDGGKSWVKKIVIFRKKAAYNDIVPLSNGDIYCIFETGKLLPYGGIVKIVIPRQSILD